MHKRCDRSLTVRTLILLQFDVVVLEAGLADEGVIARLKGDGRDVVVADDAFSVHVHVTLWFLWLFLFSFSLERSWLDVLFL